MSIATGEQSYPSEFSFKELILTLWRGRYWVVGITTIFVIVAGVLGVTSSKYYKASVVVAVANTNSAGLAGLGGMLSQIGGPLVSLAGISGGNVGDPRSEAMAIMESRALTTRFIEENGIMQILYASKWNAATKSWIVGKPGDEPTLWKANEAFKKVRKVVDDRKTGMITLTITWSDPKLAARWANGIIQMTNSYMRDKAIRESERNVEYLRSQVQKTDLVEIRNALHGLIESEFRTSMLARGRDDYALKVIDPAAPPEFPASPRLLVWLIGGFLAGAILSALLLLLRESWMEPEPKRAQA